MTQPPRFRSFPDDYLTNPDRAERAVLEFWSKADVFGAQRRRRAADARRFVFYEGPPTANGRPGIHHVFARAIKDAVCRFHWMAGARVERKAGWDTHGLPVELEVEKQLGISGKQQIESEIGIARFVELCRKSVFQYVKDWRRLSERMGYWLDYDHPYVTYDPRYIESVWFLLSRFAANGLLQKRFKVLPYCPRCGTGLSSHEVGQGYRDVQDPSVTVRFPLTNEPGTSLLVWTTTPWTLPSNVGVAVNPELDYVKVRSPRHPSEAFWVAASRRASVVPDGEVVETVKGRALEGSQYLPPFDVVDAASGKSKSAIAVLAQVAGAPSSGRLFRVHSADFVMADEGTGFVHLAPFYGADDHELCLRQGIAMVRAVGPDGRLEDAVGGVAKGTFFKDADAGLTADLKARGRLFERATLQHSYPHCWRCDTPLLYFATPAWFLTTTAYRDVMVDENRRTRWVPPEIGSGRFGEWLDGNVDWALSRARYWGTPLPVWECERRDCAAVEVIDSLARLRTRVSEKTNGNREEGFVSEIGEDFDPHRPGIDTVRIVCKACGGWMRRDLSVVDCWFDSGAMPFAQHGWPFTPESIAAVKDQFPADFIAEGLDQTRGWFYTLHAIATFVTGVDRARGAARPDLDLTRSTAYRACVVNGLVLDAEGRKMSKRLGNAVDPFRAMEEYGADAVRLLLLGSGALHVNRRFDPAAIAAVRRQVILPLVNCLQFFATYANELPSVPCRAAKPALLLDRWILSRAATVAVEVRRRMEAFDLPAAVERLGRFADGELANWYVRRNRERFRLDPNGDRAEGLAVLRDVLAVAARSLAPFAPFAAEMLWHRIHPSDENPESVHLQDFPDASELEASCGDPALEEAMELVLAAARLTRVLRERNRIRTTIPLRSLRVLVPVIGEEARSRFEEVKGLLADEVHVDAVDLLHDASGLAEYKVKPNFPVLGKKVGKAMKAVQAALESLDAARVARLRGGEPIVLELDGVEVPVGPQDVRVLAEARPGLVVESEAGVTVALDTAVEGAQLDRARVREFKRAVNQLRRDRGLALSELCSIEVVEDAGGTRLLDAIAKNREAWLGEMRASAIRGRSAEEGGPWQECEVLDGETIRFAVARSRALEKEA